MTYTVSSFGGHVTVVGLDAVAALETAVSLARAGTVVSVAEFHDGGAFHKSMTFGEVRP